MADHFTTRLALPYPDIDDPADVPIDLQQLAERLDLLIPAGSGAGLALNRAAVLDVGMAGQVRAGRQLTAGDFTALGLSAPRGLWNLSDLTDASGNARALTNKGAVTFANGINGAATTAAQFTGSTAQALYIADIGAADPFRITTGSWGCWFRTAKRGVGQHVLSRMGSAGTNAVSAYTLALGASATQATASASDGTNATVCTGTSDLGDDRWHFAVVTFDGTTIRLYVDGALDATAAFAATINQVAVPLNVGGYGADGATAAGSPFYGRVDEAFVSADVLSDEQVRNLYCARIPHTLGLVPSGVKLNVTRRRRGGAWAVADFPVQPLRLYNFTGGALTDQGSGNVLLGNAGTAPLTVAGADGAVAGALAFGATAGAHLAGLDTALPQGVASRSHGCWFKTTTTSGTMILLAWGTQAANAEFIYLNTGTLYTQSGGDAVGAGTPADGQWHHVVVVGDNAAVDGVRRRLYLDGRLIVGSAVLGSVVLAGGSSFRIGAQTNGTAPYSGQIDGVFITDAVLTAAQVAALWAKGAQALAPSPKNAGDHVEAWDAAAVYATFDTLDSNWQVDLGVAA
jgi:hypothetical protein